MTDISFSLSIPADQKVKLVVTSKGLYYSCLLVNLASQKEEGKKMFIFVFVLKYLCATFQIPEVVAVMFEVQKKSFGQQIACLLHYAP